MMAKRRLVSIRSRERFCAEEEGDCRRETTTEAATGMPSWVPRAGWPMTVSSRVGCSTRAGVGWLLDAEGTFLLWLWESFFDPLRESRRFGLYLSLSSPLLGRRPLLRWRLEELPLSTACGPLLSRTCVRGGVSWAAMVLGGLTDYLIGSSTG